MFQGLQQGIRALLGVRMALGADGTRVARLVIGDGLKLAGLGVLVGVGGSACRAANTDPMVALRYE